MPYLSRNNQLTGTLFYHVYNRGVDRKWIFENDKDKDNFLFILNRYMKKFGFKVYHWVVMSNHYHLLLELPRPEYISKIMAGLARSFAYYYNSEYDFVGRLWQGRFKTQPVEQETYLYYCARYIDRNPVVACMVDKPWKYEYSSSADIFKGSNKVPLAEPILELNRNKESWRNWYLNFILDACDDDNELFGNLENPAGSNKFKRRLVKKSGHYMPKHQGR